MQTVASERAIRDAHRLMLVVALVPIALRLTMRTPQIIHPHVAMDALLFHDFWVVSALPMAIVVFGAVVHQRLQSGLLARVLVTAQAILVSAAALAALIAWQRAKEC